MARVVLHVGPHKTGTTSIQYFLLKYFSDDQGHMDSRLRFFRPGITYRYPKGSFRVSGDVGHNGLARLFSKRFREYDPDAGRKLVDSVLSESRRNDVLIISSEDLSFLDAAEVSVLRNAFKSVDVQLVFTASPFLKRYASMYSTLVQFGCPDPIEGIQERMSKHPTFREGFFWDMIESFQPKQADLIISEPNSPPENLLRAFCSVGGFPWPKHVDADATAPKHASLGAFETDLLRLINANFCMFHELEPNTIETDAWGKYIEVRRLAINMFLDPGWRDAFPHRRIEIDTSTMDFVRTRARAITAELDELEKRGKVVIHGELKFLSSDIL